jgi:hypothetical protein
MDPNMDEVRERVKAQFASVYLTLMSVIQASVLGYLFVQADESLAHLQLRSAILLLLSFVVAGLVWHEYVMGTCTFRWIPRLPDAFLPLVLGAAQFLMARSIAVRSAAWFFALAAALGAASLAFAYQYAVARRLRENDAVFEALGAWTAVTQLLVAGGAVLALLAGWLDVRMDGASPLPALLVSVVPLGYVVRSALYWRRICPLDAPRPRAGPDA